MSVEILPPFQSVIGCPITALPFNDQIDLITRWSYRRLSKVVCVANVHMLMEAHNDPDFAAILANADLVTPDGMPLVWLMNLLGGHQDRVAGMEIFLALCHKLSQNGISVFFLGSETLILEQIHQRLDREFPNLKVAGLLPLPFRHLTPAEDEAIVRQINASGAGIVLVSLGCPKQERWMHAHQGQIRAVMVGLGGVFPIYAGLQKWAPGWVRNSGLEWFYRLIQEPRRLWRRYYETIPPFLYLAIKQLVVSWFKLRSKRSPLVKNNSILFK